MNENLKGKLLAFSCGVNEHIDSIEIYYSQVK